MAGDAQGQFLFSTNLGAVAGEVSASLSKISADLNKFIASQPDAVKSPLQSYMQQVDQSASRVVSRIVQMRQQMENELRTATMTGGKVDLNLGGEVSKLLTQFQIEAAKVGQALQLGLSRAGVNLDVGPAAAQMARSYGQAFEVVFGKARGDLRSLAQELNVVGLRTSNPRQLAHQALSLAPRGDADKAMVEYFATRYAPPVPPPAPRPPSHPVARANVPEFLPPDREYGHKGNLNRTTQMVPVEWLKQFREYDRKAAPQMTPQEWAATKASIAKEGIKEPLILDVDAKSGRVRLGEGNHRLAIAEELGLTHVPVRGMKLGLGESRGVPFPLAIQPDEGGYVPGDMSPSTIFGQMAKKADAFDKLAQQQMGKPESAMLDLKNLMGGGALGHTAEHVGDLTQRMSSLTERATFGYDRVKEKVDRALTQLEHPYGFDREHRENVAAGYRSAKKAGYSGSEKDYEAEVKEHAQRYADEHRKLTPMNDAQRQARDAAVALGEQRWDDATKHLNALKANLGTPEAWKSYAGQNVDAVAPPPLTVAAASATNTKAAAGKLLEAQKFVERINANMPDGFPLNPMGARFIPGLTDRDGASVYHDKKGKFYTFEREPAGEDGTPGEITGRKRWRLSNDMEDRLAQEGILRRDFVTTQYAREAARMPDAKLHDLRAGLLKSEEVAERLLGNLRLEGPTPSGRPLYGQDFNDPHGTIRAGQYIRDQGAIYKMGQHGTVKEMTAQDAEYAKAQQSLVGETNRLVGMREKQRVAALTEAEKTQALALRNKALADVRSGAAVKEQGVALYPDGSAVSLSRYGGKLSDDEAFIRQREYANKQRAAEETQARQMNAQFDRDVKAARAKADANVKAAAVADRRQQDEGAKYLKNKLATHAAIGQAETLNIPGIGRHYRMQGVVYGPNGMPVTTMAQGQAANALFNAQQAKAAAGAAGGSPPVGPPAPPTGPGAPFGGFFSKQGPMGKPGLSASRVMGSITSLGSYFAAAAVYGTLFKVISDTKNEILAMEEAQTNLEIALGKGAKVSADYAQELGNIAAIAGENVSTALDTAARGIRMFADSRMSEEDKRRVGSTVAEQAQQLSVIASKPLADATGDLLAIGAAFNLTEDSLSRVTDAVAVAKNNLGGSENEIAQGLASISGAAAEAGFSLEQTANMIAIMSSRTDQSGRTVATRAGRILSTLAGTTGQTVQSELEAGGIEFPDGANSAQRLMTIGRAYKDLASSQQDLVKSKLGGHANLRELIAVFEDFERFEEITGLSLSKAGEGAEQFSLLMGNIGRQIKQLVGEWTNLQTNLGKSGAFDILGALVVPLTQALKFVNLLVESWNNLPQSIRTAAFALLEYVAAMKLLGKVLAARGTAMNVPLMGTIGAGHAIPGAGLGVHGPRNPASTIGRTNLLGSASRFGWSALGTAMTPVASYQSWMGGMRAGHMGPFAPGSGNFLGRGISNLNLAKSIGGDIMSTVKGGVTRGFTAARSGLANTFASPFAKMMGALVAYELVTSAHEAAREFIRTSNDVTAPLQGETFEARQAELQGRGQASRESRKGIFGTIANIFSNQNSNIDILEARARFSGNASARGGDARREAARGMSSLIDAFDMSSVDGIAQGFKLLNENGRDANSQMDATVEVMQRLADAANGVRVALSGTQINGIADLIGESLGSVWQDVIDGMAEDRGWAQFSKTDRILDALGTVDVEALQQEAADATRVFLDENPGVDLNTDLAKRSELAARLRQIVASKIPDSIGPEDTEQLVRQFTGGLMGNLTGLVDGAQVLADQSVAMNEILRIAIANSKASGQLRGLKAAGSGGLADLTSAQQTLLELRRSYVINSGNPNVTYEQMEQLRVAILEAEQDLIKAENARIDTLVKVAQSALPLNDEVGRAKEEIDALRKQIANTTEGDAKDKLEADLRDKERKQRFTILERENARLDAQVDPRDTVGTAARQVANIASQLDAMRADGDTTSKDYWKAIGDYRDAQVALVQAELDLAHAGRLAALDPRDVLGEVVAELTDARARLAAEVPGTLGHKEAIRRVADAELEVRQEQEAIRLARAAVGDDPRSKVQGARTAVRDAASALSLALPGTAEYFKALRDLKDAQVNLADVLRAAKLTEAILAGDFTNPIEQAQHAVRDAINAYFEALSQGAPQDVLNDLELNKRKTQDDLEATIQSEKMRRARASYDLGDISHQQYVDLIKAELAWYDQQIELTYAQQDRQMELMQLLEAATAEMEGMFNLGDIRVPTPFEVRRSFAQATAGINEILNGGAYGGPGGGVTNSAVVTTNNVVINGADFARVVAYLEAVFGPGAIQRTTPVGARSI